MKHGAFRAWLRGHYGKKAFHKNGKIKRSYAVKAKAWAKKHHDVEVERMATFYLNSN